MTLEWRRMIKPNNEVITKVYANMSPAELEIIDRALDSAWLELNKNYEEQPNWKKKFIDEDSDRIEAIQKTIEKTLKEIKETNKDE